MDERHANLFEMPGVECKKQQKLATNGFAGRRPEPGGQQVQNVKRPSTQPSQQQRGSQQVPNTGLGPEWQNQGAHFSTPTHAGQPPAQSGPPQPNTHTRSPHVSQQTLNGAPATGQRQPHPGSAPAPSTINQNYDPFAERDHRRQEAERANAQAIAAEQRKQASELNARKLAAEKQREQESINARRRQKGAEEQRVFREEQTARREADQRALNQSFPGRTNSGLALPPNRNNTGLVLPPNRANTGLALPPGKPATPPQPPQPGPTPKPAGVAPGKDKAARIGGGGKGIVAGLAKQTKQASARRGGDSRFAFKQQMSGEEVTAIQAELLKRSTEQHNDLFVSEGGSVGSNGANDRHAQEAQFGFHLGVPVPTNGAEAPLPAAPSVNQAPQEITEDEKQLLACGIKKTPEPPMHSQFAGIFSEDTRRQKTKVDQTPRSQGLDQNQTSIQHPAADQPWGPRSLHSAAANGMFRQGRPNPPPAPDPHRKWALSTEERPKTAGDAVFRRNNDSPSKAGPVKGPGGRLLLGQLTLRDIKLVKWRDEGAQWGEILCWQDEEHGVILSEDPTRKRYRQVVWHLHKAGISTELCQAAVDGDKDALAEINDTLRAQGLDQSTKMPTGPECKQLNFFPEAHKADEAIRVEASDVQTYLWRTQEKPKIWAEIIQHRDDHQLLARSETWLHSRHAVIANAFQSSGLDRSRDFLSKGTRNAPEGQAALAEINDLVNQSEGSVTGGYAPRSKAPSRTGNGTTASSNQEQAIPRDEKPFVPGPQAVQPQPRPSHGFNRPSQGGTESASRSSQNQDHMQSEHPREGGKTVNDAYYRTIIGQIHENYDPELAPDEEEEPPPITDADYCHFGYQVERRECTQERAEEEDIEIDQLPWFACNDPFDSIKKANKAANRDLMLTRPGGESMVTSKSTVQTSVRYDDHGLIQLELRSEQGRVQMRVTRHLRTFRDRIAPTSKEDWAPKAVYFVKVRKGVKESDQEDLFGEGQRTTYEELRVIPSVFCSLRLANFRAIDEYVSETLVHRTANLDQRAIDRQQEVEGWREALEGEGEDVGFRHKAEDEKKVVEVWVEQGELVGPRNVF